MSHPSNTKAHAITKARVLQKLMKGTGWTVRVHENTSWYYTVWKGPISIHGHHYEGDRHVRYSVLIASHEERPPISGSGWWTGDTSELFRDPNRAVETALKHGRECVTEVLDAWNEAEQAAYGHAKLPAMVAYELADELAGISKDGEAGVLENDDAVDKLHSAISQAREIVGET